MTNEERIEERLIHAHQRGYYKKVMKNVKELEKLNSRVDIHKLFETVCDEYKDEWLKDNNDGTTEHTSH